MGPFASAFGGWRSCLTGGAVAGDVDSGFVGVPFSCLVYWVIWAGGFQSLQRILLVSTCKQETSQDGPGEVATTHFPVAASLILPTSSS